MRKARFILPTLFSALLTFNACTKGKTAIGTKIIALKFADPK